MILLVAFGCGKSFTKEDVVGSYGNINDKLVPLDGDFLAEDLCRESLLGLGGKRLPYFRTVNVLQAYSVLLVALGQYGDGVAISHTDDLARELEG